MFDFVSAAPRPNSAPSRSVGVNGGESHSASSPAGHDVVVAVQQHGRRARRRRDRAGDHGRGVRQVQPPDLDAGGGEQLAGQRERLQQGLVDPPGDRDRGDLGEPDQVRDQLRHEPGDIGTLPLHRPRIVSRARGERASFSEDE